MKITIGTRGSKLALYQANLVSEKLKAINRGLIVDIVIIKTSGDKILNASLSQFGGKGLFVKEIEEALFSGSVDIAVHSLKDVPQVIPEDLKIGAVLERDDPRDCIILKENGRLLGEKDFSRIMSSLKPGAVIGTSSLRRQSLFSRYRKDLVFEQLRGNIDTRLTKLKNGLFDAIVLSSSGLIRLGLEETIDAYLDPVKFIPQCGQGVIAIEYKRTRTELDELLDPLNDAGTMQAVFAERACIKMLDCGCASPVGAYAYINGNGRLLVKGFVSNMDGEFIEEEVSGSVGDFEETGRKLATELIDKGAFEILAKNKI